MAVLGGVNIPVSLGQGFPQQVSTVSSSLRSLLPVAAAVTASVGGISRNLAALAVTAQPIAAGIATSLASGIGLLGGALGRSLGSVGKALAAIPQQPFLTTLVGIRNLNDAVQQFVTQGLLKLLGTSQGFKALDFILSPFSGAARQLILLKVTANGVDAALGNLAIGGARSANTILSNFAKLTPLQGMTIGAGIVAGILLINRTIPLLSTSIGLVKQSFFQLLPNPATMLALNKAISSLTMGGIMQPVRYTDWVILAAILQKMVPSASLLSKTLETIVVPIKFTRNLQATIGLFNLLRSEVSRVVTQTNQMTVGLVNSAASLTQGGGFLLPGQAANAPTAFNMFDKQQGLEQAISFDQMSKGYESILKVTGSAKTEIQGLTKELLLLQVQTGQPLPELTAMADQLARSGDSAAASKDQIFAYAAASKITGESVKGLAGSVNQMMQSYDLASSQTTATTDQLTAVSLQTGTAIGTLATSMNSASAIARNSNQSFQDVLLGIGLLARQGIEGGAAANGLSTSLLKLQEAATSVGTNKNDALKALGIAPEEIINSQGQILGLSAILPKLQERIAAFSATKGEAATNSLLMSIFGAQNVDIISALVNQSVEGINQLQTAISTSGGIVKRINDEQMSGISGTLERLNAAAQGVSITLGQFLAPVFNALLQPLVSSVEWFLRMPQPIQATAFSLSILVPLLLLYHQGTKAHLYAAKAWVVLQQALNVSLAIYSGIIDNSTRAVTLNNIQSAIGNEIGKIKAFLLIAQGNAVAFLSGQMSAQVAQQKLFNLFQKIGIANAEEFFGVSKKAFGILLKHVSVLALAAGGFWAFSEAWKSFRSGQETVDQINKNTEAITKFASEINKTPTAFDKAVDGWNKFLSVLNQKGPIEAVQTALSDLDKLMGMEGSSSEYGDQNFMATTTNTQLGNQRSMEALDTQLNKVNSQLDRGQKLLQNYGIESFDAGDRTRLGADGIAKFKDEAGNQIKIIDNTIAKLREQKAPTETQQALIDSTISNLERQKNVMRGRISALSADTQATGQNAQAQQQAKFDLAALTAEQEKSLAAINLRSQAAKTAAAEALANGADERAVTAKTLQDERTAIQEKIALNAQMGEKLKVAAVGAIGEDADKIADQERKNTFESEQLKTELAENAYRQRQELNRKAIADEQLTSARAAAQIQNQERAKIAAIRQLQMGGLSGEEADRRIASAKAETTDSEINAEAAKLERLRGLRAQGAVDAEKFAQDELSITNRIEELKLQKVEQAVQAQEAARQRQIKAIESEAAIQKAASDSAVTAIEKQTQSVRSLVQEQERAKQVIEAQSGLQKAIADSQQGKTQGRIDLLSKATEARKRIDTEQDLPPEVKAALQQQLSKVGLSGSSEVGLIEKRQSLENQLAKQRTDALLQEQSVQKELLESEQQRAKFSAQIALSEARIADIKARAAEIEAKANLAKANLSGDKAAIASARAQLEAAQAGREASKDGIQIAQQNISLQAKLASTNRRKLQVEQQSARERMKESNQLKGFDQAVELAEAKARARKKAEPQKPAKEQQEIFRSENEQRNSKEFSDLKIPTNADLTKQFNSINQPLKSEEKKQVAGKQLKPDQVAKSDAEQQKQLTDRKVADQERLKNAAIAKSDAVKKGEVDAFGMLQNYFDETTAAEKKATEDRIAAREKLKKETLDKIEAVRKAEEFSIEYGAKLATLKAKQKQLKAGGGSEAKAIADEETTAISEKQTQQELELIRKRLADNDKLEKLGFRSAQEAADARQNLQKQLVDKEIQAVDQRLAAQEKLKQGILDRIEATRKAEENAIDRQANLDILAAKKQLLASGGGEKAKQQSEDAIAGINQQKTLAEIDAVRNRLADNDKLEKDGTRSPKEAAEVRRNLQGELIQKEIQLTEQQISAQERLRQKEAQRIEEAIAKSKLKSDAVVAAFEREKQAAESTNKALDQNKQILESRASLAKARTDLGQVQSQGQLDVVGRALEARKKLNSDENLTDEQRQALLGNLQSVGLANFSEGDLMNRQMAIENEIAIQKRQALEQEQAIAQSLLEIDINRNQLAAQMAVTEAQILEAKAKQAQFEAQSNLEKAKQTGDAQQIASAQAGIEAAIATRDAAGQAMALASSGVQIQAEIAANSRATLSAQQEAAKTQFEASEAARQWSQNLQKAEAATKGISNESNKASKNTSGVSASSASAGASSGAAKGGRVMVMGSKEHLMSEEAEKSYSKAIAENHDAESQQKALLSLAMGSQRNNAFFMERLQNFGMGHIAQLAGSLSGVNPLEVSRVQQDATISGGNAIAALQSLAEKIDKLANRPSVGTLNVSSPNPTQDAFGIMRDVTVNAGR